MYMYIYICILRLSTLCGQRAQQLHVGPAVALLAQHGSLRYIMSRAADIPTSAYVSMRHTSAYVSIREHTSAYGCICQHTAAGATRGGGSLRCIKR